ncbi:MAG: response regulator transcription factor [Campylobacterales bacterium]|nr:response regulator transcription factor [Campylobacterales bacterium]
MKDLTQFKSLNVLYVDDDVDACIKLEKILKYYFASVYTANSAVDAMDIYKKGRCNLLLVDYDMPIINGAEFLREIRKTGSQVPAVILSSYDDKEKLFNAIKLQLVSYLVKPYSINELKEVFYEVLTWMNEKGLLEIQLGDDLVYSYTGKILYKNENKILLAPSEFKILELLLAHEKQLISYEQLMDVIGVNCTHKSLVNQMHKLKKKLEVDIIKNVKDLGYILSK